MKVAEGIGVFDGKGVVVAAGSGVFDGSAVRVGDGWGIEPQDERIMAAVIRMHDNTLMFFIVFSFPGLSNGFLQHK